jgi:hypothetical protein
MQANRQLLRSGELASRAGVPSFANSTPMRTKWGNSPPKSPACKGSCTLHLTAHVRERALLSAEQVAKYDALRTYVPGENPAPLHHH